MPDYRHTYLSSILREWRLCDPGDDSDPAVDVREYVNVCDALSIDLTQEAMRQYIEDNEDILFIVEADFESYAQDYAEELGHDLYQWPLSEIDWKQAASSLAMDFTSITIEGEEYLYRE